MSFQTKQVVDDLVEKLFEAERRRLKKIVSSIVKENNEIWGVPNDGFLFAGRFYTEKDISHRGASKISLHSALEKKMTEYHKDENEIANDGAMFQQNLFKAFEKSLNTQMLRDTLPDCISDFIPELKAYQRINPIGYSLEPIGRDYRQFLKVVPKIEFYAATRLLY